MRVSSPAFGNDQPIPLRYSAEGDNVSPPLHVDGLPAGTRELAVICEDPDAPTAEPFVHWVAYKIPPAADLPEGVKTSAQVNDPPMFQGPNDADGVGYYGPMPPRGHGRHHYYFTVYALDAPLKAEPKLDHRALRASMAGHVLDSAEVVGVYERSR